MKKLLVMAIAAMMAVVSVNAQDERRNEISVAYGTGANTDLLMSIFKGIFTGKQLDYWGPISAEYFHFNQSGKWAFGAVAAIGGCKWDDSSNAKSRFYTAMPAVKLRWLNKNHFAMYSKAAVGLTVFDESGKDKDKTEAHINFHVSFIGLEYGSTFRVFAEAGMGEQGIVLGGLRVKFF